MGKWIFWGTLFLPILVSAQEHRLTTEWPTFETKQAPLPTQEAVPQPQVSAPQLEKEPQNQTKWIKRLGDSISLRGTDERLYIRAGETQIVLDQSGDLIINSKKTLKVTSDSDIIFKAKKDIVLDAGGKVTQEVGTP